MKMTDKIVYLITDNGMDGRAPTSIVFASYDSQECDDTYNRSKNKAYYGQSKKIIEIEKETRQAMVKLDGVQRLMLDIDQREVK